MSKICVSESALRQLLHAIEGPPHLIQELRHTRNMPGDLSDDNPINILIDEYNAHVRERVKNETDGANDGTDGETPAT